MEGVCEPSKCQLAKFQLDVPSFTARIQATARSIKWFHYYNITRLGKEESKYSRQKAGLERKGGCMIRGLA